MLNKWLDMHEAEVAWQNFCHQRYFRVSQRHGVIVSESVYPPTPPDILALAEDTFITTFMELRGWRRLPGTDGSAINDWV